MRATIRQIEDTARRYAKTLGAEDIAGIPPAKRQLATHTVANSLGISPSSVRVALGVHWNETAGQQGIDLSGGRLTKASSHEVRPRGPDLSMVTVRTAGSSETAAPAKPVVIGKGDAVDRALSGDGAARVTDTRPLTFAPKLARRGIAIDDLIPGVNVGSYGAIDPSKLSANDPALDIPIYRGMSSQDPTVHALLLTGRMIPQGRGSDYEGFKRYDHKQALDAYEWTLDPYVALKASGGHGYLVQTSLRELMSQGKVDIARKAGDSEGGIFIGSTIKPHARPVGHLDGCYDLSGTVSPTSNPKAEQFAKFLAAKVPGRGGWDEFVAAGGNGTLPLQRVRLIETKKQVDFWIDRVRDLDPSCALIPKIHKYMTKLPDDDPARAIGLARKCIAALKMKTVDLEDRQRGSDW